MAYFINLALIVLSVILVALGSAIATETMSVLVVSFGTTQLLVHYRYTVRTSGIHPLLSLDFLFLAGLAAISLALPILILIEPNAFGTNILEVVKSQYFVRAQPVALLAICGVCTGVLLYRVLRPKRAHHAPRVPRSRMDMLAIAFAAPGTLLLLYFLLSVGPYYLSGSYQDVYSVDERYETPFIVAQILLTLAAASVVCAAKCSRGRYRRISSIAMAPYIVLLAILAIHGDRGQLILCSAPLLYMLFGPALRTKKLSASGGTVSVILVIVVALLAVGVLREARDVDQRGVAPIAAAVKNLSLEESFLSSALNIGSSGLLLATAIEYSDVHGPTMGRFAAISALGAVPYSRRALMEVELISSKEYTQSADLLTWMVLGPAATSGIGTTTVADFYLDFGWIGVLIGHLFVGWIAAALQAAGAGPNADYRVRILYVMSIGVFAIMARYSATAMLIKYIVYAAIATAIASLICAELRKFGRASARAPSIGN